MHMLLTGSVLISQMHNFSIFFLVYFAYCVIVSDAVSLGGFRPTDSSDDRQQESPETCDGTLPSDDICAYENALINWNYEDMERKWNLHRERCAFTEFNRQVKEPIYPFNTAVFYNPLYVEQFLKQASIEERKNLNQVIVYHGQSLGIWLVQVLAKQLKYPHAKEWLPLRFGQDLVDVRQDDIRKSIAQSDDSDHPDSSSEFSATGLSAHVNLMSKDPFESAAYVFDHWDGISGMTGSLLSLSLYLLDPLGIPKILHNSIEERLTAILQMIGWKMRWALHPFRYAKIPDYKQLFPSLTESDIRLIQEWTLQHENNRRSDGVGVILQIVMPPKLAEKYCYASGIYGKIKDEPFLEYYSKHKNKLDDDGQLRIAMGHPFTQYPSPVKIKALSPIFQDGELMHLVHKMMKDMIASIQ